MTLTIALVLAIVAGAFLLFVTERLPVDLVALAVPVALLVGGLVTPEEAVSGFSHPATVTVAAMLMMSLGLVRTGAVSSLGRWLRRVSPGGPGMRLGLLCGLAASISPFLNNTAVVAVFLPLVVSLAREAGSAPSRFLLPLSYSAILGGTVTLVGTSTNLVVNEMAVRRGFDELSLFSVAPLGLIYLLAGFLYVFTVGRRLLPERSAGRDAVGVDARRFIGELRVPDASGSVGAAIAELDWEEEFGVALMGIHRDGRALWGPWHRDVLRAGDVLYLRGDGESLLALADSEELASPVDGAGLRLDHDARVVEFLVGPTSRLAGRDFRNRQWRARLGLTLLAIQRHGSFVGRRIARTPLQPGDLLLVHGPTEGIEVFAESPGIVALSEIETGDGNQGRAALAVAILVTAVGVAAVGLATIMSAALVGAVAMLLSGCLRLEDVYRELDWAVVFLIAGLLPLGIAMESSGAAAWAAGGMADILGPMPPWAVIAGCYLVTSLLTEVISNNAAAVVLTPVVLDLAQQVDANPYALLVAVMFGASASFMTPTGYQTNTMVYGPGGYRFADYLRIGVPLNLLLAVVATLLIPLMWP